MKTQTQPIQQNDLDLSKYDWESLLAYREKLNANKEEAEAGLKVINDELLIKLSEEKLTGKVVGQFSISKAIRYSFNTNIEVARTLGAIKEAVDSTVLKSLIQRGIDVPETKKTEYIIIREINQNE